MKRQFLAVLAAPLLLLSACDQPQTETAPVEVVDLGSAENSAVVSSSSEAEETTVAATTAVPAQPAVEITDADPDSLENGQYSLSIEGAEVTLHAMQASRIAILEDIADRTAVTLAVGGEPDRLVSVNVEAVGLEVALAALLDEVRFSLGYAANAGDNGLRINQLLVGTPAQNGNGVGAASVSQTGDGSGLNNGALGNEPLFLGNEPDQVELVQRLLSGDVDERIDAVYELETGPRGLNAAFQVYRNDTSAEVRLAVVEIMDGQDNMAARQLITEALDDADSEVALYALGVVDSNTDFTLLSKVQSLTQHPDPEVAEYAREVEESIRLSFEDSQ